MADPAPIPAGAETAAPPSPWDAGWCGLAWTPWAPLERQALRPSAVEAPGVYRVRRADGVEVRLVYLGQTGRTLRERLLALAAGVNARECPFNDPHTAAPHLWLLRRLDGARLEFSCAPVPGETATLRGTEDMLLWRHRVETGAPTEANHGRFYPGYARPTNRWVVRSGPSGARTAGRRAAPLAGAAQADFGLSHPALCGAGGVLQAPWWRREPLSAARRLPDGPAVYCLHDRGAAESVYIGETLGLARRAAIHGARPWPVAEPWIVHLPLPHDTPRHVLRELESDLLGWHFWQTGRAPAAQYTGSPERRPTDSGGIG